eukprot:364633-Chlamydomonas_euryale.AAC.3
MQEPDLKNFPAHTEGLVHATTLQHTRYDPPRGKMGNKERASLLSLSRRSGHESTLCQDFCMERAPIASPRTANRGSSNRHGSPFKWDRPPGDISGVPDVS